MRPAKFLKSTPFRLAVTFALLFIAAFLAAGTAAYVTMKNNLAGRLDRQITDTFTAFEGLYEKGDNTDLISAIDRLAGASTGHDRIYLIRSADGSRLAGNIATTPSTSGWMTAGAPAFGIVDEDLQFRAFAGQIGDLEVTVGASLETTAEILETASSSFIWATIAVLLLAIGGGVFLASRAQRRIELIGSTMTAIGEGRLDARIPLTRAMDDIDDLSAQINAALERLRRQVDGMRQVSTAIAHDLKTPISRLYIAIETALDRAKEGKQDTAGLNDALSAAKQVNETFDALLRITQIEAGARRSRFTDIDLSQVLDVVYDAYAAVAEEEGHVLSLNTPSHQALPTFGDRELLIQLLANLTDNAIRHSPRGSKIFLEGVEATNGRGAEIVVSDDGPGIPLAERENVFQRLYRLEKSRTTAGSGLGLSMVKAIADLHGATITLSDNAPGLRVSVVFPSHAVPSGGAAS